MNDEERNQPVTRGEFADFLNNHFSDLVKKVENISGQIKFLLPLMMALLAGIIYLATH